MRDDSLENKSNGLVGYAIATFCIIFGFFGLCLVVEVGFG